MSRSAVALLLSLVLGATTLSILARPRAAETQQPAKVWRVGWLSNVPAAALMNTEVFRQTFREVGYVEGQNLVLEFRWADDPDRLAELAGELVRRKVDVILAVGPLAIRAATRATDTIPIVIATSGDPVGLGFVESLARPGGNVTGVSFLGEELSGKLLELLKEAVPRAARVAVLWSPANSAHSRYWEDVRAAAHALRLTLQSVEVHGTEEFKPAFARATREHADALLFLLDPLFTANSRLIADLATMNRLPTIYGLRQLAEAGGLMAYGPSSVELTRRQVVYVDKLLKGAKPGDLPVEQASKFELVVNLKTAKALGLTIPPSVLARADELIQ